MNKLVRALLIACLLPIFAASATESAPAAAAVQAGPERVYVAFRPGGKAAVVAAVRAAAGTIHYEFDSLGAIAVTLPSQAVTALRSNPNVAYIEADPIREPYAQTIPYGIDRVQARDIWDANRDGGIDPGAPTGSTRNVCIIDSGFYQAHEDFDAVNVSGSNDSGSGKWYEDGCGHGTHVAGTVAAVNNGLGVVGVTPGTAQLRIVKVFGSECSWTYSSTLVNAANACANADANIISMSLGGSFSSTTESNAFANLYNNGILHVAAAGNGGNTRTSYPAGYASVISVAAVDQNNVLASFSQRNSTVELAAPGVGVLSTVPWTTATVTVDGTTYQAGLIDGAAQASVSGTLVNGSLCDSVGSWSGRVVLCERGSISFAQKVSNVESGGGVAAVIYNNVSGGFAGTLNGSSDIPAVSLSQEDGQFLVANNKFGKTATVDSRSTKPGSGYEAWDGTSMATPHVSGVAALIWSANDGWSNAQIRTALQNTALDLGAAGRDNSFGYGLVQAKAALDYLQGGSTPNSPPTASFTYWCDGLSCTFTDTSTDSDGTIVSYAWNFGDLTSSTAQSPNKTYAAGGTYSVELTVTDDDGAKSSATQSVTVSSGGGTTINLSVLAYKVRGAQTVDLTWSGATSTSVDVYRNDVKIITTANAGTYTDNINNRGGGSYTYQICEAGTTTTCSNNATATF